MGRPKGAKAKGPRVELEVIGLDSLPAEIPEWEFRLIAESLRAVVGGKRRARDLDGGGDAPS